MKTPISTSSFASSQSVRHLRRHASQSAINRMTHTYKTFGTHIKLATLSRFRIGLYASILAFGNAQANMTVYPMSVNFGASGESAKTIQVYSKSDETQFVQATVKRVIDPATPQEREETVSNWQGVGLVVSPPKFALPAGASRAVRIVALSSPKIEEVYRIYLERAALPSEDQVNIKSPVDSSVSVNLIWGVLVNLQPTEARVTLERPGPKTLRNSGNIRVALVEAGSCSGLDDASCKWTKLGRNLYPGTDLELPGAAAAATLRIKYQVEGTRDIQVKDLGPAG